MLANKTSDHKITFRPTAICFYFLANYLGSLESLDILEVTCRAVLHKSACSSKEIRAVLLSKMCSWQTDNISVIKQCNFVVLK